MVEVIATLNLSPTFLDNHTLGELESKIWGWLEDYGLPQGTLEDNGYYIRIQIVRE